MAEAPVEQPPRVDLREARRREKISQAEWRRQRAEVARLVAAGEEAAAEKLLSQVGIETPSPASFEREQPQASSLAPEWEASPEADSSQRAVAVGATESASGEASHSRKKSSPRDTSLGKPKQEPRGTSAKKAKAERLRRAVKPSRRKRRRTKTWREWLERRPPWAMSLVVHSLLIVAFGLLSFATLGDPAFSLSLSMDDSDAWDDMPAEVTLVDFETDAKQELTEPLEAAPDLSQEIDLESLVEPAVLEPVAFEPAAELGDLLSISAESLGAAVPTAKSGDGGQGEAAEAVAAKLAGKPGKVSFFGAESRAERVVFVVDNSGSMQRGRMETTLMELDRAVTRLSTSQEFYVVFFSDQAYPMFFPEPVDGPIQATRPNKRRLSAWLRTVEICLGGRLLDAMEMAAGMEPDVVFLLSDGDIRSERVAQRMTAPGEWPFVINTLGMGARTPQHAMILGAIAKNTGGVFRPVAAHPAAVVRARQKPIPYHRQAGPVWGSAVQDWD